MCCPLPMPCCRDPAAGGCPLRRLRLVMTTPSRAERITWRSTGRSPRSRTPAAAPWRSPTDAFHDPVATGCTRRALRRYDDSDPGPEHLIVCESVFNRPRRTGSTSMPSSPPTWRSTYPECSAWSAASPAMRTPSLCGSSGAVPSLRRDITARASAWRSRGRHAAACRRARRCTHRRRRSRRR